MILRFARLLLLLTMLAVPPTSTVPAAGAVNLDKCTSRSLCILHKDCFTTSTSRGSIEWLHYPGAGTLSNRPCSKAVEITPLSASSWSVEMHGVAQLDSLVTCTGGVAKSSHDKVIIRTHSRPPSSSSSSSSNTRPLPSTHCRAQLSTKDGSELKSLLSSSSTIKVDSKDSDMKFEAVSGMTCHPPASLFSCVNESRQLGAGSGGLKSGSGSSGDCALPVRQLLKMERGGKREEVVRWSCEEPLKMHSSQLPYHPDSVQCVQGKMWIVEEKQERKEHSLDSGTRIACRMSSEDICDGLKTNLKTNSSSKLKWENSTRVKCADDSPMLAGGQKSAWLACSDLSTIDHPVMETDGGQFVSVDGVVDCARSFICKPDYLTYECGVYSVNCPPDSCKHAANYTTLWPAQNNGSISAFGVEIDGFRCDPSTHRWLAHRTDLAGGKNRTIEVGRGSKVACTKREEDTRSLARLSIQLREEKAATIGLPAALMLALIVIPLIFHTSAHSIVSRCMNGSDRGRHAKLSAGVTQCNDLELNSDRAAHTIQSKYGSEIQKISIAECIRQFFRDRCGKKKSLVEQESVRKDEEEKSGNIVEVTAPAKDSVVEPKSNPPSVIKSAPASLPSGPVKSGGPESTEKKDEEKREEGKDEKEGMKELSGMAQPTSSVSKQITKSDPPSQVSKATSSNSGGVPSKQQSASGAAPSS